MVATMLLSSLLVTQAEPVRVPPFQPRLNVRIQPAQRRPPVLPLHRGDEREIICGMVVVRRTPADDPKILLPARRTGAVIRRIEPQGCTARQSVTAK